MINFVLEKQPVDDVAEIAERFDEGELKAVVADGRLVEWLVDHIEDEIAERVKALGGDINSDDFTERLITALWPDAQAAEAKKARARVTAARERAAEAERQRQEDEEEARAKKAEAEKLVAMLAAEQERDKAAQAKAKAEKRAKKAKTEKKVGRPSSSRAMALLRRQAQIEAAFHHLKEAWHFKLLWVSRRTDSWGVGVVFLNRNFHVISEELSLQIDEYDIHMRPGSIFKL